MKIKAIFLGIKFLFYLDIYGEIVYQGFYKKFQKK